MSKTKKASDRAFDPNITARSVHPNRWHLLWIRTADPCDGFRALIQDDGARGHGPADDPDHGMKNGCHALAPYSSYTGRQAHGGRSSSGDGDPDSTVSSGHGDDGEISDDGA